jgi:hypothetical protein
MVYVLLWFHSYESKFCCVSDIVVLSLFFPLVDFVSGSIVSHVSVLIPVDYRLVAYLSSFMDAASRIGFIELWQLMFSVYILHLELSCSTIQPRTPRTPNHASFYDEIVYPT